MVLLLVGFGINYEKISNLPLLCLSILSRYKFIFFISTSLLRAYFDDSIKGDHKKRRNKSDRD